MSIFFFGKWNFNWILILEYGAINLGHKTGVKGLRYVSFFLFIHGQSGFAVAGFVWVGCESGGGCICGGLFILVAG